MPVGRPRRLLLDSPSLMYRAFFALPRSIRSPAGRSVNAVRGYLDMTSQLLRDRRPAGIVHVLDADWRPAWRVAAYPGYKSQRAEDPPELAGQPELIREALELAGMPVAAATGYEADDVLGTIAVAADDSGPVDIVTGDRDLFQLVRDPAVRVLFTARGVSDLRIYDEAAVLARYGVPASRYVDFAILRGDPSDGLPGLAGVGEKAAAQLVRGYTSLEALVAAAPSQPPRLAATLRDSAGYLAAMRTVVPVATDVAFSVTDARPPVAEALVELGRREGIEGPVERLLAARALIA